MDACWPFNILTRYQLSCAEWCCEPSAAGPLRHQADQARKAAGRDGLELMGDNWTTHRKNATGQPRASLRPTLTRGRPRRAAAKATVARGGKRPRYRRPPLQFAPELERGTTTQRDATGAAVASWWSAGCVPNPTTSNYGVVLTRGSRHGRSCARPAQLTRAPRPDGDGEGPETHATSMGASAQDPQIRQVGAAAAHAPTVPSSTHHHLYGAAFTLHCAPRPATPAHTEALPT